MIYPFVVVVVVVVVLLCAGVNSLSYPIYLV